MVDITSPPVTPENDIWKIIKMLLLICIAIIIAYCIYLLCDYVGKMQASKSTPTNNAQIEKTQQNAITNTMTRSTVKEKFANKRQDLLSLLSRIPKNQQVLANFSVLTVYNAGYIGPFQNGVYSEVFSVTNALSLGARGFFLNIDYDINDTKYRPLLISRDANGYRTNNGSFVNISINAKAKTQNDPVELLGGDPALVLSTLAANAFDTTSDPLFVYLYFEKTPDPVKNQSNYITFLSKIAGMLQPFRKNHLRINDRGDFTRQRQNTAMLLYPIGEYEKQVLFFTNIDTSVFQQRAYTEDKDLDYWIHMRCFTNSTAALGVTSKVKDANLIRGYIQNLAYYTQTPPDNEADVVGNTKINWNVGISKAPSIKEEDAKYCLDTLGIQMIPFHFFPPDNEPLLALYSESSFRIKPEAIRYTIPAPQVIVAQNPKLNSNGGLLPSPPNPLTS